MANVNFQYRSKKPAANLEVRFTFKENGKYKSFYTRSNIEVTKAFWNDYKKNTNFRDVEKANLKNDIETRLSEIDKFISDRYKKESNSITKEWLKDTVFDFYNPKNESEVSDDLLQFFDFFLLKKKNEIKLGTVRRWNVVRNKVEKFQNDMNRTFKIRDVNTSFLNEFTEWSKRMNYDNSVINGNFKDIKS